MRDHSKSPDRLLRPGFLALIGTTIGIGLFFGSMQVSVTAFAVDRGTAVARRTALQRDQSGRACWPDSPTVQGVGGCPRAASSYWYSPALSISTVPLLIVDNPWAVGLR